MKLPLSVLDLSPVSAGVAPSQAVRESIELCVAAERLGYTRYWFAEHHNMASIAASAPEILIAYAAAKTSRIRLGAGGIMVPNHAPLHVVETFRTLEALAPGRIDLGLGRAPGTDPVTSAALRREHVEVNQLLAELLAFEDGAFPPSHAFAKIVPMPSDVPCSTLWMLGSTLAGASIGAQLGVPYAFAGHFAMQHARTAIAHYKDRFEPSHRLARPYAMCAVTVICGEDDDHARRLTAPVRVTVVNTRTGKRAPIPSIEDALARTFTPEEQAIADDFLAGAVIGGPERVHDRLLALAEELAVDELMISSLVPGLDERRRALERIATVLG
ncbi:MAG TPA: LLM class flavin-dependent oxidoreductase [Kofleriaceae bacterium]|nr:LLM class flavin-dependent oxidoreductase [Kofleriaceae bacterium]